MGLRRVSVHPDAQGRGVARALVRHAEQVAAERGPTPTRVLARVGAAPHRAVLAATWGTSRPTATGPSSRWSKVLPVEVGDPIGRRGPRARRPARRALRPGDLVILSGDLGAGKTTFTQGIGAGLRVRGDVTSPTFVISRVHPLAGGRAGPGARRRLPARRHRRARRPRPRHLPRGGGHRRRVGRGCRRGAGRHPPGGADHPGARRAEQAADDATDAEPGDDPRTLRFTPVGARWVGAGLRPLLSAPLA